MAGNFGGVSARRGCISIVYINTHWRQISVQSYRTEISLRRIFAFRYLIQIPWDTICDFSDFTFFFDYFWLCSVVILGNIILPRCLGFEALHSLNIEWTPPTERIRSIWYTPIERILIFIWYTPLWTDINIHSDTFALHSLNIRVNAPYRTNFHLIYLFRTDINIHSDPFCILSILEWTPPIERIFIWYTHSWTNLIFIRT